MELWGVLVYTLLQRFQGTADIQAAWTLSSDLLENVLHYS